MNRISFLLAIALFLFSACEKDETTLSSKETEVPENVSMRSGTGSVSTYAVSLYRPGQAAEIYELDACTGDYFGAPPIPVQTASGRLVENVIGIEWLQPIVGYNSTSFHVVSLGDNSAAGLPAIYSNTIWEIDLQTGILTNLLLTPPSPLMDICWGDFAVGGSNYFVGFIGVEEAPSNGQHYAGFYQGTNYNNLNYVNLPIDGVPAWEEVQGLTWVRDASSGCPPPVDALDGSQVSLHLSTYDPTTQEYHFYALAFQAGPGGMQLKSQLYDISPINLPSPNTHCSLGWISDEQTGLPFGTLLTGGNLHQLPMINTHYTPFDHCNPQLTPGQPTPNSINVELADFVTIPYLMW